MVTRVASNNSNSRISSTSLASNSSSAPLLSKIRSLWSDMALSHRFFTESKCRSLTFSFLTYNHLLIDEENLVFCPPPAGKPNPDMPLDPEGLKPRPRVAQPPQHGDTCAYYGADLIRQHIGKYPLDSHIQPRKIEQLISEAQEEIPKLDAELTLQLEASQAMTEDWGIDGILTKKIAQDILKKIQQATPCEQRDFCHTILREFSNQTDYDDLVPYIHAKLAQKSIEIDEKILAQLNEPINPAQKNLIAVSIFQKEWKHLSILKKKFVISNFANLIRWQAQGLQPSHWHPSQTIDALMTNLRLHGPHLITAKMGRVYYIDKPFQLDTKVAGQAIYGWKPNAQRSKPYFSSVCHVVVLVGANRDQKRVYFIDPLDGSDPEKEEYPKIYATSYKRLQETIFSLSGKHFNNEISDQPYFEFCLEGANNYAMHSNPATAYL